MGRDWKQDVRESVYQILCDQLYILPENMNDDLDFEKELLNGPGDRVLMFAALQKRFHIKLDELEYLYPDSMTVGALIDYIHARF
jgi:acyl carrier protein